MKSPLFSICIPTRNRAGIIQKALETCLQQTYQNLEIVVVDNASEDNTREVVSSYAHKDSRIRYFRNDRNLGVIRNILKAFESANGEYVQYLADDNELAENYVEEKIRCFSEHPEVGLVSSTVKKYRMSSKGLELVISSEMKEGIIDSDFAFLHLAKLSGWFGLLCTARRVDMLSAIARLGEIPNAYGYDYLNSEMAYDVLLFVLILSAYPSMYFTEKTTYYDQITPSEMVDPTKFNLVRWYHMYRGAVEYAFSVGNLEKYITLYRGILGSSLFLDLLKRTFWGPRTGIGFRFLTKFYGDYRGKDWLACIREFFPLLGSRLSRRLRRS